MSTKKRRERDRERMRGRILDAARQLFVREGFDTVSMRRIASAIEYSPAAIYRYFKNKREILSELRNEAFDRFIEGQQGRKDVYDDPYERLLAGGKGYMQFAIEEPDRFHLMFGTNCDQVDMEGDLASSSLESFRRFRANVEECVDSGHMGDVDLDTVVFGLWSGLHGLAHLRMTGQVEALSGREIDEFIDSILRFMLRPGINTQADS